MTTNAMCANCAHFTRGSRLDYGRCGKLKERLIAWSAHNIEGVFRSPVTSEVPAASMADRCSFYERAALADQGPDE